MNCDIKGQRDVDEFYHQLHTSLYHYKTVLKIEVVFSHGWTNNYECDCLFLTHLLAYRLSFSTMCLLTMYTVVIF